MGDYVVDPYPMQNFINIRLPPFSPPNTRNCASSDWVIFWFFLLPTAKTPAPIFTIDTSNDVVSRKDVPFGNPENKILHFDPIFHPKRKFLANLRRDKISRQKDLNNGDAREETTLNRHRSPMKVV